MDFTTLFSDNITTASQTISAVNCFGEYVSSKFNDLANFMSGNGAFASVYFTHSGDNVINKLGCVSSEMYESACEEPDRLFQVGVKDGWDVGEEGSLITVSGRDITDAFELQLSELRCQEQYLTYCLNAENCTSTEFLTRVRSLSPNISGAVMEKFSRLIDISGSSIDCLKNFFSLFQVTDVQYTDQFISLVNYNDYLGNIWQSAWQQVTNKVTSFFSGVWQGIRDIGGFFKRLLDAVVNLGKWIMSKAFGNLNTYYDKASSAAAGIMDLPIFQVYGGVVEWQGFADLIAKNDFLCYSWDGFNHVVNYKNIAPYYVPSVLNLVKDNFEGVYYNSVSEVIVPSDPYDISLRVGINTRNEIVLSMYVVSDFGTWSKYDDIEHNRRIFSSVRSALKFMSKLVPVVYGKQDVGDTTVKFQDITEMFINYDMLSTNEFAQCLTFQSKPIGSTAVTSSNDQIALINSVLSYLILMSKGFRDLNLQNVTNKILLENLFSSSGNTYTPNVEEQQYIDILDPSDIDLSVVNADTFRPYSKRNQLPVTIHYQTSSERGREIIDAMLKLIISSVVVVSTVKLTKWNANRSKNTMLAHAKVDKLAWDVAANPSEENKKSFNKAWSKARRMDFVNGILGASSGSDTDTISNMIGTMTNMIGKDVNESSIAAENNSNISANFGSLDQQIAELRKLIR